jgi:hypothetical protein
MHVFALMVWGGFFLVWPRATLIATVAIPVAFTLLFVYGH